MEKALAPAMPALSTQPTHLPPELTRLTTGEREVLYLVASGANNREIAEALYISESTFKNHITHILSQLSLRDRTQDIKADRMVWVSITLNPRSSPHWKLWLQMNY